MHSNHLNSARETSVSTSSLEGLITQAEAKRLAGGISDMTLWRWRNAGIIPAPISIRRRNYWRRSDFLYAVQHPPILETPKV